MNDPVSILITDDRPENLLSLEELLSEEGTEIIKARSGREALGLSLRHDFALVLLDVQMPEMDGFETAELMRGNPKTRHIPIIFVTAGDKSSANLFKGYESGAVDYIFKPVDPVILRSKVRIFSELYRQRRAIERQEEVLERQVEERTRELCHALELASASSKAKSEFLANMSHEIRTPMTGIMGAIDLLHDHPLNDEQQQYLEIISSSASTLLALIDDILDLSKIEAEKISVAHQPFALRSSLQAVIAAQQGRIREKALQFILDIRPEVPEEIPGDDLRLKQVILNLLGNAIKFTPPGGEIVLTVALKGEAQGPQELQISLRDSGIGIKEEDLPRIFKPFEQADTSMTRRFGGSGLGLTICQRLIALMGGTITVESKENCGSNFIVALPLGRFEAEGAALPDQNVATGKGELPSQLPRSILLVEDSPISQKVIKSMLTRHGYSVITADNGREALSVLEREQVDLALMDIQMPVMDGVDTVIEIRNQERRGRDHLPIIAVTAHALDGDREKYLQTGFDEYLAKPFQKNELFEKIARMFTLSAPTGGTINRGMTG